MADRGLIQVKIRGNYGDDQFQDEDQFFPPLYQS